MKRFLYIKPTKVPEKEQFSANYNMQKKTITMR